MLDRVIINVDWLGTEEDIQPLEPIEKFIFEAAAKVQVRETPAMDTLPRTTPIAVGKSLGKPTEMDEPAGKGFVFLKVIVYVELAPTSIEDETRLVDAKGTAVPVTVTLFVSISVTVDVL
jgi:hypothetical protein